MKISARARRAAAAVVLALSAAACDLGPDAPSTATGRIEGHPALGAAVLDVVWRGAVSFEGRGSTQVYAAAVPGSPDHWRVVLVSPEISDLAFAAKVESSLLDAPIITVVEAANIGNLAVDVAPLRVSIER
ncbi:MAG: hypothetical protein AB7T31_00585 [Gemmatimonadales bacterium]